MAAALMLGTACGNGHDGLKEQASEVLNTVLTDGQRWEKVHAAEFLIELGQVARVRDVFMSESDKNGDIPEYRIGIWRVLYKCAGEEERRAWQDSIHRAFVLPESPDRIHAVETLAKLEIPVEAADAEVVRSAMASDDYRLRFYTQWWAIPQLGNGAEELKGHLFQLIGSDGENPARKLAAYVLNEDRDIRFDTGEWQSLESFAVSEPADSDVRLLLLAAVFSKVPADREHSGSFDNIEKLLLEYKYAAKPELYQLCLALARKGKTKYRDTLKPLLDHSDNDVKIAAAYAITKIQDLK